MNMPGDFVEPAVSVVRSKKIKAVKRNADTSKSVVAGGDDCGCKADQGCCQNKGCCREGKCPAEMHSSCMGDTEGRDFLKKIGDHDEVVGSYILENKQSLVNYFKTRGIDISH